MFQSFGADIIHRYMNPKPCFFIAVCHEYSAYFVGEAKIILSALLGNRFSISI
jgi:hypothetical protein